MTSEADTAREALDRNTEAMARVVAGLKAAGIDAKDIATSSFNVEPRYSNPREGAAPAITGYRVSNQVHVTVRDLARARCSIGSSVWAPTRWAACRSR